MPPKAQVAINFQVFTRWRPSNTETSTSKVQYSTKQQDSKYSVSLNSGSDSGRLKIWNSGPAFTHVFTAEDDNSVVYQRVVAHTLPQIMSGETCNFFAYGRSGSGKTHTIIGYDYKDTKRLGLCFAAAKDLFLALEEIIKTVPRSQGVNADANQELGIAVRLYEIRGKNAYDLLNNGTKCHVREGPDGRTHIRGETEMLEGGKVQVRPIAEKACWTLESLQETIITGLGQRKVGSSSVHDESSRTHAIIELEIVDKDLLEKRIALSERESELVPVGKRATDICLEETMRSLTKNADGTYAQNLERPVNQAVIDAAEVEKKTHEVAVAAAENAVAQCFTLSPHACLGGKFVFVDLAGSEYFESSVSSGSEKQTREEQQQGRQINTDLFALKEVIRARALGQSRTPYRASPLTMVLRSHFEGFGKGIGKGTSAMVLTVSDEDGMSAATRNTLKYGCLVGLAGAR